MRPVSAWLERFRRPAGVPAAAGEELEAELLPVFAVLDEVEEDARRLRQEAEREAGRRRDEGAAKSERLIAEWRRRADAERTRAETERRQAVASEVRAIEAAAAEEVVRLRERGGSRIPELVADIVACLTEEDR
jgi:hypothetical protein